jgi:hypothetical protein
VLRVAGRNRRQPGFPNQTIAQIELFKPDHYRY